MRTTCRNPLLSEAVIPTIQEKPTGTEAEYHVVILF